MKYNVFGPPDHNWMFDYLDERPAEERERFLELTLKRMLHVNSREEAAQRLLGADSSVEMAQKALGADSAVEMAQKALGADSAVEMAFKVLSTEEQRREFLERLQQTS